MLGLFVCCLLLCKQGTVYDMNCRRREYFHVGERGLYRSSPDGNGDSFEALSSSPGPVLWYLRGEAAYKECGPYWQLSPKTPFGKRDVGFVLWVYS